MNSRRSTQTLLTTSTGRGLQTSSRSGIYGVSSRRNVAFDSKLDKVPIKKAAVQVLDDIGNDVTPRSLLGSDATVINIGKNSSKTVINFNDSSSVGTPSELLNQSMFGASTLQASYAAGFSRSIMSSMMGSSKASLDSVADEISEQSHMHTFAGLQDIEHKKAEVKEDLQPDDLKKMVHITLEETDTIWHLDMPGICANNSNPEEMMQVKEKNDKYEQLCSNRAGNDMFVHRGMQTFNNALKTKEMQTISVGVREIGCMATNWDMYDAYIKDEVKVEEDMGEDDIFTHLDSKQNVEEVSVSHASLSDSVGQSTETKSQNQSVLTESVASLVSTTSTHGGGGGEPLERGSSTPAADFEIQMNKISKLSSMKENTFITERIVVQNLYHSRQAAYRGVEDLLFAPTVPTKSEETNDSTIKLGPNIARLWSYECTATKGLAVTCMVWNKINKDLLGVGYGENGFNADGKGMACVWSIKNPEHPERLYTLDSAVVSIDFSATHPNFLAVGLYDGTIAVYNIRHTKDSVVLDNINSIGKHAAPVWQLRWVDRDKGTGEEKGEVLVSSSADGRVTQWSIKKGFEYLDLMKLKRLNSTTSSSNKKSSDAAASKKSDALISRYAAGMCFDFHPTDGNIYLAGTEEGHLHRCSCSYNEQFLETYSGHKGSVYRSLWSPFDEEVFLSCSADWTVRLWHSDKTQPALTLQASTKGIVDIDWSPISAVVFAAIDVQQIQIWDLSVSTLDPLIVNLPVTKVNLTSVKFSLNSEALLVGDCEGHVTIYQLREMNFDVANQNDGWLAKVLNSTVSQNMEEVNNKDGSQSESVDR